MQVFDYLRKKYNLHPATTPTTLLAAEAKIFGIPMPLQKGWAHRYGNTEITEAMAFRLRSSMEVRAKRGQRFAAEAIEILDGIPSGAPHPPVNNKKSTKTKKAKRPTQKTVAKFVSSTGIDPTSDDFLSSFEWRSIRMMALKKYKPVCQCCGASPATGAVMNVDHIKPRKFFPHLALDIENLQVLCGDCNHGKGNWDSTDWR